MHSNAQNSAHSAGLWTTKTDDAGDALMVPADSFVAASCTGSVEV